MTIQQIRRLRETTPFEPFRLLVASGQHYDVMHPENIAFIGNGRLISVGLDDHFVTLDLLLVSGVEHPIPSHRAAS